MAEAWAGPPRLLVLDIDGTLLEPDHEITDRVRSALSRARAAGCQVVLATGRASFEVVEFFRLTGLDEGMAVCSNGAVIASMPSGEVLFKETFDARPVLATLLEHVPSARIAVEVAGVGYAVTAAFPDGEMLGPQTVEDLQSVLAEPVIRVVVRDPEQTSEDFHALTARLAIRGASFAVGYRAWLDLGPLGVSKASGLRKVAAMLGISPFETLAIGDGHNDLEMIQWAGRGVAMGHSPPELREIADAVTDSVARDGAALEIEKWFPPNKTITASF